MTATTSITSDWVKIANMNVTAATGFSSGNYTQHMEPANVRGDTGSNFMKYKIQGTEIFGFFGVSGYSYNPNLIFFCD